MTIRNKSAVQKVRSQMVSFNIADIPPGVFVPLFEVPQGTMIKGGLSYVVAVATGTTNVLDFGTAGAANSLLNDDDAKTLGGTAFTGVNTFYPAGAIIGVTRTETGTASVVGDYIASVDYQVLGTVDEIHG